MPGCHRGRAKGTVPGLSVSESAYRVEKNQAHRSAELEYGSEEILMKTCVEAPVDLLDNWMAVPPWDRSWLGKRGG